MTATTTPANETDALAAGLRSLLGGDVANLRRLTGGASRETWVFDQESAEGVRPLILRRDPPEAKRGMSHEVRALRAARSAGVPVPDVLASDDRSDALGSPFVVMSFVEGETIPRRILRDDGFEQARDLLVGQCASTLARLHAVDADAVDLPISDELATYRSAYERSGVSRATIELALRWLDRQPTPVCDRPSIVHGDFRMGNLMVDSTGLRAVLDWELAHRGDPIEDLGWFCVRAWRFGGPGEAGGVGSIDDLVTAYESAGGRPVDRDHLRWWIVVGTFKWAVGCILQANSHLSGLVRSVELAAIGRRVCENELDLLDLLDWSSR